MPKQKSAKVSKEAQENLSFPIVAVGASAGGLAAFEAFFSGMPLDHSMDMAFVLIQHLAPDHASILAELIRRYTPMNVYEVQDGMSVEPNCVYIIPPKYDMAFLNGKLQLLEHEANTSRNHSIDFFFHSLAQDKEKDAIGIILSGTGNDGAQGIKSIKEKGGITIVQTPKSTEYDGMPRSAMATGDVDYLLEPLDMAQTLLECTANRLKNGLLNTASPVFKSKNMLDKIFILLRSQTGHDFSHYKISTIHRRIERRMAICQIVEIDEYVKYLQQTPDEVIALFHDMLIGVTNFFRDPEAFEALKTTVIPQLFVSGNGIRIWCVACSTGEEAYSLAILLKEHMEETKQHASVQIFATDIDPQAIATARAGFYPESIAVDISQERLKRFFVAESGGYRIHKNIRDMLIFSEQSVIKDPPFSKMDLISCRNLLIYMNSDLQKKIIPLYHYALKPEGILFLGSSESIGEFSTLFDVVDQKSKIFRASKVVGTSEYSSLNRSFGDVLPVLAPRISQKAYITPKLPLREIMEQALIRQSTLCGALVNVHGDILYLHGQVGRFLELPSGETGVMNILKMGREGLSRELTIALHKASETTTTIYFPNIRIENNGQSILVSVAVRSVSALLESEMNAPLFAVFFEEVSQSTSVLSESSLGGDDQERIAILTQELYEQEAFLQIANKKLATSNEELKAFNEEMQSLNEELQSTNEELETSKEELQSVNEELSTVNTELQTKVVDLSQTNNDMNNLLAGTNIGTLFVDHSLCVMRFTPAITQIVHLIPSDLGRPIAHIVLDLTTYNNLVLDTQSVLDTLIPKEIEVQTNQNEWYLMRIQPYRTLDNVIEGGVISFINISEIVQMREALRQANKLSRLAVVVNDAFDAIIVQSLSGETLAWNAGAIRIYGWSEEEAIGMNMRERMVESESKLFAVTSLEKAAMLEPYRTKRKCKNGDIVDVWIIATPLVNEKGEMYALATTERSIEVNNG